MSLEGRQLGRYSLIELLGSGGMGEVYLAEDTQVERQVAIKVIRSELTSDQSSDEHQRLFERELKAIARLTHPNILPLFDYGEETLGKMTLTYLVMPLRQQGTLADWLRGIGGSGKLAPSAIAHMIAQCAEALQYAHDHEIVHQDVKPSNFLLRPRRDQAAPPFLQLADFGIARFNTATASISHNIRGTPSYMSPEQWEGHPVPATDQYALAVMAYLLLTGQTPFRGNMAEVMRQHFSAQPRPPTQLNARLPAAVDTVLAQALAKKPQERFASVSEFAQALHAALLPPSPPTHELIDITSEQDAVLEKENTSAPQPQPGDPILTSAKTTLAAPPPTRLAWRKFSLLLALLLIVVSSGLFYLVNIYDVNMALQAHATATAAANTATVQSVSTDIASENSTATALANSIASGPAISTAVAEANTTAALTAARNNPYPSGGGRLVLDDSLHDNKKGYNWNESSGNERCSFSSGAYIATDLDSNYFTTCFAQSTDFTDFVFQVQMAIVRGDSGGICFRGDGSSKFYYFRVGSNGSYNLYLFMGSTPNTGKTLATGSLPSFHTSGAINQVAVVAHGNTIDLYVNMQRATSIHDSTYSHGEIGVAAEDDSGPATSVVYADARAWQL